LQLTQLLLWGIFLRVIVGLHATTTDDSRNNRWVALLSFGEGWHKNHQAHPASARHGLAWYKVDFNW